MATFHRLFLREITEMFTKYRETFPARTLCGLLTKCEVNMAGYWPSFFFCVFMSRDGIEVNKLAKMNEANI